MIMVCFSPQDISLYGAHGVISAAIKHALSNSHPPIDFITTRLLGVSSDVF